MIVLALIWSGAACQVPNPKPGQAGSFEATSINRVSYGSGPRAWMDIAEPDGEIRGVVAYVHGGAWMSGSAAWSEVHPSIKSLVDGGVVVASIEYRLVPETTETGQVLDVLRAVRALRARYHADIVLAGHSAGGHIAALAGLYSDQAAGVILLAAPGDLSDLATNPTRIFGYALSGVVSAALGCGEIDPDGTLSCDKNQLRRGNILAKIRTDSPPAYIAYGTRDDVVLPKYSEKLARTWENFVGSKNVWIDKLEDHGHDAGGVNTLALGMFVQFVLGRTKTGITAGS